MVRARHQSRGSDISNPGEHLLPGGVEGAPHREIAENIVDPGGNGCVTPG
jgi:hypothetical protein